MKLTNQPHEARDSLHEQIAGRGLTLTACESMDTFGWASSDAVAEFLDAPFSRISTDAPILDCRPAAQAIATQTLSRVPSPMHQWASA